MGLHIQRTKGLGLEPVLSLWANVQTQGLGHWVHQLKNYSLITANAIVSASYGTDVDSRLVILWLKDYIRQLRH
jgi:hypothetical protein